MDKKELLKAFAEWAKNEKELTIESAYKYKGYLRDVASYQEVKNGSKKEFVHYLDVVCRFLTEGDIYYALTICELAIQDDTPSNQKSGLRKLNKYIRLNYPCVRPITKNINANSFLNQIRRSIHKPQLHKLDGMEQLIDTMGLDLFIKRAVEQSYFFHPDIISDRSTKIQNTQDFLPARKSTKEEENDSYRQEFNQNEGKWYFYFCENKSTRQIPILRDEVGNNPVKGLIKKYVGYSIGEGIESVFQNYIISHIWGNAYDPRFFTSFWNIAIIPAWANSLMDKKNVADDSPAGRLKATFMELCRQLYVECKLPSKYVSVTGFSSLPKTEGKPYPGSYAIRLLCPKSEKEKVGGIIIVDKTIT